MDNIYASMIKDQIAVITAEADRAQAAIDEGRKLPNQQPEFIFQLDASQIRLNIQRAKIRNLQSTVDILNTPK